MEGYHFSHDSLLLCKLPIDPTANEEHASRKRSHIDTLLDVNQGNCDGSFKTSARWEASEELDAFLSVMLKPMPRFDRRAIIREFPRPRPTSIAAIPPSSSQG